MQKTIALLVVYGFLSLTLSHAQPQWTQRTPYPTPYNLNGVTWTGSQYVAAGNQGTILFSTDGINWQARFSGTKSNLHSITWTGSQCMAVGASGTVLTSTDCSAWKNQPIDSVTTLTAITWTGSLYVATGYNAIYTSKNGIDWKKKETGALDNLSAVLYAGNKIFIPLDSSRIIVSDDGEIWNLLLVSENYYEHVNTVVWTGGFYYAVFSDLDIYSSADCVTWKRLDGNLLMNSNYLYAMCWDGARIIALNTEGIGALTTKLSSASVTWEKINIPFPHKLNQVIFNGRQFVAVGDSGTIAYSANGSGWNYLYGRHYPTLRALSWNGSRFIAVGDSGVTFSSENGFQWTPALLSNRYNFKALCNSKDLFVAAGDSGLLATTATGASWDMITIDKRISLTALTWNKNLSMAAGYTQTDSGIILASPDGAVWTRRQLPSDRKCYRLNCVIPAQDRYVAAGYRNILTSDDGAAWVNREYPAFASEIYALCWTGTTCFAAGGYYSYPMYYSADCINWNPKAIAMPSGCNFTAMTSNGIHTFATVKADKNLLQWYGDILFWKDTSEVIRSATGYQVNLFSIISTPALLVAAGENGTILTAPQEITAIKTTAPGKVPPISWSIRGNALIITLCADKKSLPLKLFTPSGRMIPIPAARKSANRYAFDLSGLATGAYCFKAAVPGMTASGIFFLIR